ncbi:MAG: hypothetical protein ETSY1_34135, partial [Candidatus Entotheonella factor]
MMRIRSHMIMIVAVFMIYAGASVTTTVVQASTRLQYAELCAQEIAEIQPFSCMDGVEIPITVNGKTPTEYTPKMTCDRPALLDNNLGGFTSDGQCVPHSRILNQSKGHLQISIMCRQKKIRSADDTQFDEIDIITHNANTGATCWFQAKSSDHTPISGKDVPSPQDPDRATFWESPKTVKEEACGNCHDNDPFMYSPFIGQVWQHVPTNPFGRYYHVDGGFG